MRPVTQTIVVQVPTPRLFAHVAARWEVGRVPAPEVEAMQPAPTGRMGDGFTVVCPAHCWALPVDAEMVVTEYRPPAGWQVVSPEPAVLWQTELAPTSNDRTRLTCRIDYRARSSAARFRELIRGRRRRARTLHRLVRRWREEAERQETLRRLRATTAGLRRDSHEDADSTH